jgi:hypothetical protein
VQKVLGEKTRAAIACLAVLGAVGTAGCGNNQADAGNNSSANKAAAASAGVAQGAPQTRTARPPFDPSK